MDSTPPHIIPSTLIPTDQQQELNKIINSIKLKFLQVKGNVNEGLLLEDIKKWILKFESILIKKEGLDDIAHRRLADIANLISNKLNDLMGAEGETDLIQKIEHLVIDLQWIMGTRPPSPTF